MTRSINLSFAVMLALGGIPGAAHAQAAERPKAAGPIGNVASWFTDSDYPVSAKRAGQQGRVAVVVSIDEQGKVVGCRVVATSGSAALDERTCELVRLRGTFQSQLNAAGRAVPYTYPVATRWVMRGYFPPVIEMAWRSTATYKIDRTGKVESCSIDTVGATPAEFGVRCPEGALAPNVVVELRSGVDVPGSVEVSLEKALQFDGEPPFNMAYQASGGSPISLTIIHFDTDAKGMIANCRITSQIGVVPKDLCKNVAALFAPRPAPPRGVTMTVALSRMIGK